MTTAAEALRELAEQEERRAQAYRLNATLHQKNAESATASAEQCETYAKAWRQAADRMEEEQPKHTVHAGMHGITVDNTTVLHPSTLTGTASWPGKGTGHPKPTVGRIVHYCRKGTGRPGTPGQHVGEIVPAIITRVFDDGTVALKIFYYRVEDPWHTDCYPYSEQPEAGHWSWPPRA